MNSSKKTTAFRKFAFSIITVHLIFSQTSTNIISASSIESTDTIITIISVPHLEAIVGQQYFYKLKATTNNSCLCDVDFKLIKSPDNMSLDNGILSWQTEALAESAEVIIEAYDKNGIAMADTQSFYLNITYEANCKESLLNLYKLDELSEGIPDDIKDRNNFANILVNPKIEDGIINKSLRLNNASLVEEFREGIEIAFPDSFNWFSEESFTISVWIKPIYFTSTKNQVVIGRDSRSKTSEFVHFWLGIDTNYYARFYLQDNQGNPLKDDSVYWDGGVKDKTGKNLADGEWHHLAAVRDGAEQKNKLYVDGVLVDESIQYNYPSDFVMPSGLGPVTIGYMDIANIYCYNGYIDEIAIFNEALEESEISSYYSGVVNFAKGFCSGDNSAPNFSSPPVTSATLGETYTYNISFDDQDEGDYIKFSATFPDWLSLNYVKGQKSATLTGIPSENQHSYVKLTIDDGVNQSYQEFNIYIKDKENQAPTITSVSSNSVLEDEQYNYKISFTDPDANDSVFIQIENLPDWLTFDTLNKTISGVPVNSDVGEYNFSISIFDLAGNSDTENVALSVINTNDPPKIISVSPEQIEEDKTYIYEIIAIDYDLNDTVILSVNALPIWLEFDTSNNIIRGIPGNDEVGEYNFDILAEDTDGEKFTEHVSLSVLNTNDPPTVISVIDTAIIRSDSVFTILLNNLNIEDVDNNVPDDLTLIVIEGQNYTFSGADITPNSEFNGILYVNIKISDGIDTSNIFEMPIIVKNSLGTQNYNYLTDFQVYPNPVKDILYINFNSNLFHKANIKIFDSAGQLVKESLLNESNNQLYLNKLKTGNYFYQITVENKITSSGTLVIQD